MKLASQTAITTATVTVNASMSTAAQHVHDLFIRTNYNVLMIGAMLVFVRDVVCVMKYMPATAGLLRPTLELVTNLVLPQLLIATPKVAKPWYRCACSPRARSYVLDSMLESCEDPDTMIGRAASLTMHELQ